jgi:hypothetical protein
MTPLQQARASYRQWTDAALREAIASTAQLTLAAAGTLALATGTAAYWANAKDPSRVFAATGAIATCAAGAYAAYKWVDCPADWETWKRLNSGENRAHLATTMAQAQADQLKQLVLAWGQPQGRSEYLSPAPELSQPPTTSLSLSTSDLALTLGRDLRSSIIVGQSRSGKGFAVAHALRHAKVHHPDLKIWVIDPKADPQEQAYWDCCDRVHARPLLAFSTVAEVKEWTRQVDAFIKEFKVAPGPKLLILDEALGVKEFTGKWFKGLMAGFNYLCSTGASQGCYGWIISQTSNAEDFNISGGARNVYRGIALVHSADLGLIRNKTTFFSGRPSQELLQVTGRAFYDSAGDYWGAVPGYPPLSRTVSQPPHSSRRLALERAWAIPALSPNAATVLEYLQRRNQRAQLTGGNAEPIDVAELCHNLTAPPYRLGRGDTREAIAELATARLATLRDGAVTLRDPSQPG